MTTGTALAGRLVVAWLADAGREITAQADRLSDLDRAIGDGDHGSMSSPRLRFAFGRLLDGVGRGVWPKLALVMSASPSRSIVRGRRMQKCEQHLTCPLRREE